ncbi:hypothetical protein MTY414_62250 [Mycolicibacterium mageritense]|nr:hypothetical protein MTY414_62250 [Mycolicibacterium mageritense]
MAMRWFARPESDTRELRVAPRLASWNKADHPDQVRLRAFLDDAEALLAGSRIDVPWALRLDVGLPAARDLLDGGDLDNYAYPLACRVRDAGLVSVWCTKQHTERSFVRIEAAREISPPSTGVLMAKTTASTSSAAYKEQIYAAVAVAEELPDGPVRLELSFAVGARRNWLNLWKQTIDSLDPILGRTYPDRRWHPRDGRITELGMHVTVCEDAGNDVTVAITASPAPQIAHTNGECFSNSIRAEIEQILINHPRTRYAKVLLGMRRGLTDAEMAEEAVKAGEPINADSVADVRRVVRLSLDDQLVPASSDAAGQAGLYRELLNYPRSPGLMQHINTKLAKLRARDPKIPLTPLGHVHLGANGAPKPAKPESVCPDCFMVHAGECP